MVRPGTVTDARCHVGALLCWTAVVLLAGCGNGESKPHRTSADEACLGGLCAAAGAAGAVSAEALEGSEYSAHGGAGEEPAASSGIDGGSETIGGTGSEGETDGAAGTETEQTGEDCDSSAEECDGVDNDCDGEVDEDLPEAGEACETGLAGACSEGEQSCKDGRVVCEPIQAAADEVCDGVDND